ncbi:MAG TPA: selenite/tellurite reduction operon b-type cytochrome ExtP [Thermomicrobiales bacterium]|nr:selenite/tellurite reduction operon b-type cytochrome ExtP [Thermomicrobiales bacterium]
MRRQATLVDRITSSQVYRSIVRSGYPDTPRNQALVVLGNVFLHLHPVRIRRHALALPFTFCLGGFSFFLFLLLTVTGVLLMFYYIPSTTQAYLNMQDLQTSVTLGQLMRNLHRYSAQAMVIVVFLHMCRVFYTGSYKTPREFNWVIGVCLLFLTFLMSFTGYLLPWDQLAFWAITVGTQLASYAPLVGPQIRFLLIGGFDVGQNGLLRFYTLHVIFLPLLAAMLMAAHFWRIRKDGGISGPL